MAYFKSILSDVPVYIYYILILVFCIGLVYVMYKRKNVARNMALLLMTEYLFAIYCFTVVFRYARGKRKYDFSPFWSYDKPELLVENIMNALVFVPVGLLLGCAIKGIEWWKVIIIGLVISMSIELLQFYYKKGFAELDDVMHNVLGCMIGFGVYSLVKWSYGKFASPKE